MRRSVSALLVASELGIVAWWFWNARLETGVDALQYHRMAAAIVGNSMAPWAVSPLSYLGVYPGSDSSGIPFLAAEFSLLSGLSISPIVLFYDGILLLLMGMGVFTLTKHLTARADLGLFAVLLGSLAFGFFTTISWSLDERSFNVAVTPLFLAILVRAQRTMPLTKRIPEFAAIGIVSFVMLLSHLSFLLLVPFFVLVPLLYQVIRRQYAGRRRWSASAMYFGAITLSPLLLLTGLDQLGLLGTFHLETQLENSALFSGTSPLVFVLNAAVFVGTRIGPVNLAFAIIGLLFLGSRRSLPETRVILGGLLLVSFLSLPLVTYSKDLQTPILVVIAAIGVGSIVRPNRHRRVLTLALAGSIVVSGSIAFDTWNLGRTSKSNATQFWALPGITPEAQQGDLWMSASNAAHGCAYGNNPLLLQEVTTEPALPFCTGLPIDALINAGSAVSLTSPFFHAVFVGFTASSPTDWFTSPELNRISDDFARIPSLHLQTARPLLLKYHVSLVIVDLQKPYEVPLYAYQGSQLSPFFTDLWQEVFPVYESHSFAVFELA